MSDPPDQWLSTFSVRVPPEAREDILRGTGRHLAVQVKTEKGNRDEHIIFRTRFRASHRRPRCKNIIFESAISLSLYLA
jgi:hypothetical protein